MHLRKAELALRRDVPKTPPKPEHSVAHPPLKPQRTDGHRGAPARKVFCYAPKKHLEPQRTDGHRGATARKVFCYAPKKHLKPQPTDGHRGAPARKVFCYAPKKHLKPQSTDEHFSYASTMPSARG